MALAPTTTAPTDRAIANLPIDKRPGGNIDRQIDWWKRETRLADKRSAKAKAGRRREDKATAKALLAEHMDAIIAQHGDRFGAKALRQELTSAAKWEPERLIALVRKLVSTPARSAS